MTSGAPKCFISYSHADRPVAERLTNELGSRGLQVWLDALQIRPGDSLVEKIFEEGLKDCDLFLILLSKVSVTSPWVRQELDIALLNRLKKITRVIPVLVEECEIPVALRALRWLNLNEGLTRAADLIAATAFDATAPPAPTSPPEFVKRAVKPRAGLSQEAATVAGFLARTVSTKDLMSHDVDGHAISEGTALPAELINDAVDELRANGLVRVHKFLGTAPYEFGLVEPTYALAYTFPDYIDGEIQPQADVAQVAAAIASLGEADGRQLSEHLKFEPNRINFAVEYLRDYGLIETRDYLGTAPFSFGRAVATRATRQLVRQ
jgi:hypothetical protein